MAAQAERRCACGWRAVAGGAHPQCPPDLVVTLHRRQLPQGLLVILPQLVLVALHKAQQALVPHHRHAPLVVSKPAGTHARWGGTRETDSAAGQSADA